MVEYHVNGNPIRQTVKASQISRVKNLLTKEKIYIIVKLNCEASNNMNWQLSEHAIKKHQIDRMKYSDIFCGEPPQFEQTFGRGQFSRAKLNSSTSSTHVNNTSKSQLNNSTNKSQSAHNSNSNNQASSKQKKSATSNNAQTSNSKKTTSTQNGAAAVNQNGKNKSAAASASSHTSNNANKKAKNNTNEATSDDDGSILGDNDPEANQNALRIVQILNKKSETIIFRNY